MRLKRVILLLLLSLAGFQASAQEGMTRILFILDASNSMNAMWDGQTRITAAKELLLRSMDSIKDIPNLEMALRVYGHQSIVTPTYQDCNDTKLEVPFGPNNFSAIRGVLYRIQAKGTTPIARSLEAAAIDFPNATAKNIIILITDGLEACDGDPCVIAKKLRDKNINVTPFVIGLGLDLSYLEKFKCIGEYSQAETKTEFKAALENILQKTINDCTVQIDLNDITKKPTETDVSVYMYEAGTKKLRYSFIHTLNVKGLPDTLKLDPNTKYDIEVHTIPTVYKKGVTILKNQHNTIKIDAPQGFVKVSSPTSNKALFIQSRIVSLDNKTLNVQNLEATDKYIVGKYQLEILTLPRITKTITVEQSTTTTVNVPAPGILSYRFNSNAVAQLFVLNDKKEWEWVINLDANSKDGQYQLQPGEYRLVYRYKKLKTTDLYKQKEFKIMSNKSILISL